MSEDQYDIPNNGLSCANTLGLDWNVINKCVTSGEGSQLFSESIKRVRPGTNDTISCTINMNDEFWCQHNGEWVGCDEGNDSASFVKAVCKRYQGQSALCQKVLQDEDETEQKQTPSTPTVKQPIKRQPKHQPLIALE